MKIVNSENRRLYRHIYDFMGKKKFPYITLNILCLIYDATAVLIYSYLYKMIFNSVEYNQIDVFKRACIFCAIFFVLDYFGIYLFYFKIKQIRVIVFNVKIKMFDKLANMNIKYFEENHSGDTLKRLNWDANCLKDLYLSGIYRVLQPVCTGIVALTMMVIYSWKLSVCSIIFSVITVELSLYINRIIRLQSKEIQKSLSKLAERLSDLLSGFLIIKMYAGSEIVIKRYLLENENAKKTTVKRARVLSNMEMLSFLSGMLGSFGTIAVGIFLVTKGEMDYGTIMAIVTLQLIICGNLQRFGGAMASLTDLLARVQRVSEFLELDNEEKPKEELLDIRQEQYSEGIKIENLSFSYETDKIENAVRVLDDFSLTVAAGERIMLVGQSGCGKSTLLKLLMGFYQKTSGNIKIFGNPIEKYDLSQLRGFITYVPQESYLFEGTIEENIRYGNPNADKEAVVKAAKMAYADTFIKGFANGYETLVAAGGHNFSGGQRQRIAIARAFLKDAPIILLDEPSSALDVESEGMINLAMKELMKGKIVIMVTHRTNSFKDFDRVVDIQAG